MTGASPASSLACWPCPPAARMCCRATAHISYFDPKPLFEAVDPELSEGGQQMSEALAMIADAVQ